MSEVFHTHRVAATFQRKQAVLWCAAVMLSLLWGEVQALPQWLKYTLPSHTRYEWSDPTAGPDSLHVECNSGPASVPLKALQKAYLYQVTAQGGAVVVDSHSVIATGAVADSFPVPGPGTYYVRTRNNVGYSCASNPVTVYPDVPTGVEPEIPQPMRCSLFNVQGQLVAKLEGEDCWQRVMRNKDFASGVYWIKWQDGATRKVVVLK